MAPMVQLSPAVPSMGVNSLSKASALHTPHLITQSVTAVLLVSAVMIFWCLFIEFVALVTRKVIDQLAAFIVSECYHSAPTSRPPEPARRHALLPYVMVHMLIDQTCPISSHTPAELPAEKDDGVRQVLPERLFSPCGICEDGIGMGELKRTLPCDHRFHARCIDNVCIMESFQKVARAKGCFECPLCEFVVVPTPELLEECLAMSTVSSDSIGSA